MTAAWRITRPPRVERSTCQLDQDALKDRIKGMTVSQAHVILDPLGQATITLSPDFMPALPDDPSRIDLEPHAAREPRTVTNHYPASTTRPCPVSGWRHGGLSGTRPYRVTRLLGIDLGERRIGVALGDPRTGSARPLLTLSRGTSQTDAATLARLAREHDADELVIGLPLSLDGSEGPQAERTRDWAAAVAPLCGLAVSWQDERHTSEDAEQRIGGPGARSARAAHRPPPRCVRIAHAWIARPRPPSPRRRWTPDRAVHVDPVRP